jgi:demethylmenaquinone methyltransferase/2-methoxy-6-polyprenyl-1,4-benzoquinol methylase
MFDLIASRYDLLNRLMSFGTDQSWRRKAVRALELRPGDRVLDLATGTCDMAILVAQTEPTAAVVGLDPSEKMLEMGRRKLATRGIRDRVTLVAGDAQTLPFPERSFDGLCMAFGIRNVPDRMRALREMARVTRRGRHIVLLELSEPTNDWLGAFARWHVHVLVPFLGGLLSGSREYRYLQRSIAAFPPVEAFRAMITEAGLRVRDVQPLSFGACHLYVATVPEES